MIAINRQLAKLIVKNCFACGRVNPMSAAKAYIIQANIKLNALYDATDMLHKGMPRYTEKEVAAAEVVQWMFAYLAAIKCKDIEALLKDTANYRAAHPDKPRGAWPWTH